MLISFRRITGLNNNRYIQFRNIDNISKRICNELNNECALETSLNTVYVNVSGACATGYTQESYYNKNKVSISIVFLHIRALIKNTKILHFSLFGQMQSFLVISYMLKKNIIDSVKPV